MPGRDDADALSPRAAAPPSIASALNAATHDDASGNGYYVYIQPVYGTSWSVYVYKVTDDGATLTQMGGAMGCRAAPARHDVEVEGIRDPGRQGPEQRLRRLEVRSVQLLEIRENDTGAHLACLLDAAGQQVFPDWFALSERPHLHKALASAPRSTRPMRCIEAQRGSVARRRAGSATASINAMVNAGLSIPRGSAATERARAWSPAYIRLYAN